MFSGNGLPVSFRAAATNIEHENLSSVNSGFDKLMSVRDSMFAKPTPPKVDFGKTNLGPQESPNVLMEQNMKTPYLLIFGLEHDCDWHY